MARLRKRLVHVISILLLIFIAINCKTGSDPTNPNKPPETLQDIVTRMQEWVNNGQMVGAELLIIRSREIILHEVVGLRDVERNFPMEKNTICRIRSMTKPFVGTAILMLMEQGLVSVTDKVSTYLPCFNNDKCREITIKQLLTHTGGFEQPGYPGSVVDYDNLKQLVEAIGTAGPTYPPGERYSYSDAGSSTLAYLVTILSGIPVEDFIHTRIIEPLALVDTFCNLSDHDPRRSRVSCTYDLNSSGQWYKYWDNSYPQEVRFFRGSGGIYSTTTDYSRFLAMWMDQGISGSIRFLTPETVQQALTPSSQSTAAVSPYGFQWMIYDDPVFGHSGSDGTLAWADPVNDLMILYFTQSRGNNTTRQIVDLVLRVLY